MENSIWCNNLALQAEFAKAYNEKEKKKKEEDSKPKKKYSSRYGKVTVTKKPNGTEREEKDTLDDFSTNG